ncbi:MAG: hypothetical protein L6420_12075 [Elusimicrobia bacterium]|nr:hypothetical protein [Elusimicrobiota bacterium]
MTKIEKEEIKEILRDSATSCELPDEFIDSFVKSGIKAYSKAVKESRKSKYPSESEFKKFLAT